MLILDEADELLSNILLIKYMIFFKISRPEIQVCLMRATMNNTLQYN